MKLFVIVYVICASYHIVRAVLPKPRINRDNVMATTVIDREVPDNEISDSFRRKLHDVIDSVKWNAKFKQWADLCIQALSNPISKLNEMTNSVGYHPNYDMWLDRLRQKALEKGEKILSAGVSKLTDALDELHAYLRLYIDKMHKKMLTSQDAQIEDFIYMDYTENTTE